MILEFNKDKDIDIENLKRYNKEKYIVLLYLDNEEEIVDFFDDEIRAYKLYQELLYNKKKKLIRAEAVCFTVIVNNEEYEFLEKYTILEVIKKETSKK